MAAPLRILEIGAYSFAKFAQPGHTTLLWTGRRPPGSLARAEYEDCTPARFVKAIRAANAGAYDCVVTHLETMPPWHPRYWLRSLAREPRRPLTAASRVFGVSWLRYASLRVPLIAVDLNDSFLIGRHNVFLMDKADLFFKRELPVDRWHMLSGFAHTGLPSRRKRWVQRLAKVEPLALPTPILDVSDLWAGDFPEKTADVFFCGNVDENSWVRRAGIEELRGLRQRGIRVDIPEPPIPPDEFARRLSRAWLAWSPAGFGWECNRTAEAAQCLTVPLLTHATIVRHQPLREGEHAFFYPVEPGGLSAAVERALADKDRLRRIAHAARAHVLSHHVWPALVEHVVARVREFERAREPQAPSAR
jgi:hypothetical protein